MSSLDILIGEIEAFCAQTQMAETAFGVAALNDGRFVARIRSGTSSPTLKTVDRVRAFMARERAGRVATQHAADCAQTAPATATKDFVRNRSNEVAA